MNGVTNIRCEAMESRQLLSGGYAIVDLLPGVTAAGLTSPTVAGISADGDRVVGQAAAGAAGEVAIVWGAAGRHGARRVTVLPSLGGDAAAAGVNDAGQVVGSFHVTSDPASAQHACEWHWNRSRGRWVVTDLGTAVGGETGTGSVATAINEAGTVVGAVTGIPDAEGIGGKRGDAVVWTSGNAASAVNLSKTLHQTGGPGGLQSVDGPFKATAINDAGTIAGTLTDQGGMGGEAYVWRMGAGNAMTAKHLGVGMAWAVSADGAVAVNTAVGDNIGANAFLYRQVTRTKYAATLFEPFSGGIRSFVSAMNAAGVAAGSCIVPLLPESNVVSVWRARQGRLKVASVFNQLPAGSAWTSLDSVAGIDDAGEIVGSGTLSGSSHPFLVVPT